MRLNDGEEGSAAAAAAAAGGMLAAHVDAAEGGLLVRDAKVEGDDVEAVEFNEFVEFVELVEVVEVGDMAKDGECEHGDDDSGSDVDDTGPGVGELEAPSVAAAAAAAGSGFVDPAALPSRSGDAVSDWLNLICSASHDLKSMAGRAASAACTSHPFIPTARRAPCAVSAGTPTRVDRMAEHVDASLS